MYPFPVAQILNPIHADFNLYCVYVCMDGGYFMFFFVMLFFEFRGNHPIIFLPNKQKWMDILNDANIFKETS